MQIRDGGQASGGVNFNQQQPQAKVSNKVEIKDCLKDGNKTTPEDSVQLSTNQTPESKEMDDWKKQADILKSKANAGKDTFTEWRKYASMTDNGHGHPASDVRPFPGL